MFWFVFCLFFLACLGFLLFFFSPDPISDAARTGASVNVNSYFMQIEKRQKAKSNTQTDRLVLNTAYGSMIFVSSFIYPEAAMNLEHYLYGDGLFFIIIDVYDSSGYYYLGGSICVDDDNGSMMVYNLSSFPVGSLLAIYMYRYQITETIIPPNGSTLEGVGQVGLVGTATLAN